MKDIIPLGTVLEGGCRVEGVQSMGGERYYFLINTGGTGIGYMPADVVEKDYHTEEDK